MKRLTMESRVFDGPTTVTIEAGEEVIREQRLNTLDGEEFDKIEAVVSMDVTRDRVTFTTVRTHAAWKRGEANAGRGTWEFPRSALAGVYVAESAVSSTHLKVLHGRCPICGHYGNDCEGTTA